MILKFFGVGMDWDHQQRLRESMLNNSISVCPLWLLYKCHKGWTMETGKVPPTRPVAGGNAGMNFPLSEVVSWVLEPLASTMEGGELVSGEDLKSNLDKLNVKNKNWKPEPYSDVKVMDMPGAKTSDDLPKLCGCDMDDCEFDDEETEGDDKVPEGVPGDADDEPQVRCVDKEVNRDLSDSYPGEEHQKPITNRRNKAMNMRMRREEFKETRKKRHCRKQPNIDVKMMNSKDVPQDLVQNKSIPMVIIGSDVASLYPNLRWGPAGEEVYQAIMDTEMEFEGLNYMEGARYLALVRGKDWCMKSKLRRVLPSRSKKQGSRPTITGEDPMGPSVNSEKQWDFPNVEISEKEKRMIVGEIMRMAVEILFKTHCYSFKGSVFRQVDGGPIGLRATCAIARVVMCMHNKKWRTIKAYNKISITFDGFYVYNRRIVIFSIRAGWRWCDGSLWFLRGVG